MKHWIETRHNQILLLIILLFAALFARLFVLSVLETDKWATAADSLSIKTVTVSAPRGEIYDSRGRLLAGNRVSFVVEFADSSFTAKELNTQALLLMDILEANGDAIEDDLPIVIDTAGRYSYTYQNTIEEWLFENDMSPTYSAQEAFDELRARHGIDPALDVYEAQAELQNTYGVYPPISVRVMKYTQTLNLESFLGRYESSLKKRGYDYTVSAEDCFRMLREVYKIDDTNPGLSAQDARKIILIRDALAAQGYVAYVPITVAKNISDQSVITLGERSTDLPAVNVSVEYVRTYPNGTAAAHILGYLGKISESDKAEYLAKGYTVTDFIGKDGIEKVYEDALRGTDGKRTVQVNVYGELEQVLSETEAKKGESVTLTIDLELQKTAEEALAQALEKIPVGGTFESEYGDYKFSTKYKNATVGAVVALDVKTAEVLAMASNPAFDPNLFATGITQTDWDSLQPENTRDPLAPRPLYNVATRTAVQPGSSFKIVTATAALQAGLSPTRRYRDGGAIQWGERTYGCVLWNLYHTNHGLLNLYEAIGVSCNYYFYDLISNTDWATGRSLGLSDEMGIDLVLDYAEQYGLGQPTGIEIGEASTTLPSAEKKLAATIASLKSVLKRDAKSYFTPETVADSEALADTIDIISGWAKENPTRGAIVSRLADLPVLEDRIEPLADLCKYSYFNMANWTLGDYFNISIGQGENAYTPLQIANMIATVGNNGLRNDVTVVKAVGDTEPERSEPVQVSVDNEKYFRDLITGMERVAQSPSGSGYGLFWNFPAKVAAKTGTAERSGKIQPPDEVEYVKENLAKINRALVWEDVEAEMQRILREEESVSSVSALHTAVINLSNGAVTDDDINKYKDDYDNFSWFVALCPADDPKIAVAALIFNGGTGGYAGTVVREVIGKYLELEQEYAAEGAGTAN